MTAYIVSFVLGIAFGFALNKAGLTKYHKIVNVFRFTDMAVLKFMMTALVVSMSGLYALRGLGLVTFPAPPATYVVGNLVGVSSSAWAWRWLVFAPAQRRQARATANWIISSPACSAS
jgi:hypothetical protein